ncbi:hypothetical protein LCGC14_1494660 [marine sediment metagenome]|uniref:Uncharacterized protein n=1 Tax=marine sediment metagenome TaxID=412755 RepID=A0A0F9J6C7_9ZZZZ
MLYLGRELKFGQKKHIDFDKIEQIFYDNLYFEDINFVLKVPLISLTKKNNCDELKIEKFDLSKYIYLIPYV